MRWHIGLKRQIVLNIDVNLFYTHYNSVQQFIRYILLKIQIYDYFILNNEHWLFVTCIKIIQMYKQDDLV